MEPNEIVDQLSSLFSSVSILDQTNLNEYDSINPYEIVKPNKSQTDPDSDSKTTEDENKSDSPKLGKKDPSIFTPLNPDSDLSLSTLSDIATYIRKNKLKKIIVMAGAGISTSAGIPDFRTKGTGLYDNLEKLNLPYPEAIFEINYFKRFPSAFFTLAKELLPGQYNPTTSHYFIKMLYDLGILLRVYSQNIDMLELLAGVPEDYLVACHGTFANATCIGPIINDSECSSDNESFNIDGCGKQYKLVDIKDTILSSKIPKCDECSGIIKPGKSISFVGYIDIVFFGESLPERFHRLISIDFKQCDLLIVMGTSLQVQPFAGLIDFPSSNVPRLLINREKSGVSFLPGKGFDFKNKTSKRDVFHQGSCDEACLELAELLGMKEELLVLHKKNE